MLIVHVEILVKPEFIDSFIAATQANAKASRLESGIAQFDLIRRQDNTCAFLLVEAYKTNDAPATHKETAHYKLWAQTVAPFMAAPRSSVKYESI